MAEAAVRVAWDMTHAGRIKTGTGVYARYMLDALGMEGTVGVVPLTAPQAPSKRAMGLRKILRGVRQVWWTQLGLAKEARRCGATLVHAPAFVSSLFLSCPLIVTIHDIAYWRYPEHYSRAWLLYLRLLVPGVVRRAKAVVADSYSTKQDAIRHLGIPSEKVHVIHLGVDHARFRRIADRSRLNVIAERYGLSGPFILHVGALAARKDIPTLVEAMCLLKRERRHSTYKLVLAGEETAGLPGRVAIAAAVKRCSLEQEVLFLGHVPDEHLPAIYNLADLVAMPSLYEGFGLPLLEAMACGTPVVASNTSSLPEVVGDAGLLVPPMDSRALAEAIERVLSDSGLRERLIERGLARAMGFTWERAARETVEVYQWVLATAPSGTFTTGEGKEGACVPHRSP